MSTSLSYTHENRAEKIGTLFLAALCALLSLAGVLGILAPSFGMQRLASARSRTLRLANAPLSTYFGGPVMAGNMNVYAIFWFPGVNPDMKTYMGAITQYYQDVRGNRLYNMLSEYPSKNGTPITTTLKGVYVDPPDGNLWFTEAFGNNIGKITPEGVFLKEYALPHADSEPENIVTGPDGNLWFTEFNGGRIGTITTSGQITEYSLPQAGIEPEGITSGPCDDGTQNKCLWFTEQQVSDGLPTNNNAIWRITTGGTMTEYPLPIYARANEITLGANGVLYFTEQLNNDTDVNPVAQASIGEITYSNGQVQISTLASLRNGGSLPNGIVEGSDGNLWFTEYYQIGTVTPGGTLTEYPLPASSSSFLPNNITAGPDGNLWFTEYIGSNIGRITV